MEGAHTRRGASFNQPRVRLNVVNSREEAASAVSEVARIQTEFVLMDRITQLLRLSQSHRQSERGFTLNHD